MCDFGPVWIHPLAEGMLTSALSCRMYGHAFEAFKIIVTDHDQVFNRLQDETNGGQPIEALTDAVKEGIIKNVRRRMTPQPIKIRADVELKPHAIADGIHPAKYRDQFHRRLKRGQCHHQPYLGTREFSAFFAEPDDEPTVSVTDDLGLILFDVNVQANGKGTLEYLSHNSNGAKHTKGQAKPKFFRAKLENGVLRVPPEFYEVTA